MSIRIELFISLWSLKCEQIANKAMRYNRNHSNRINGLTFVLLFVCLLSYLFVFFTQRMLILGELQRKKNCIKVCFFSCN